jgi:microcystin-dependent protein
MQIPSLLSDIASLIKNERTDVAMRLAVITSYVPGDLFVGLRIGGSTSEVRGRFVNYDPAVGETVQVIQDGLDPIVIGKVGSTGPGLAVPIGLIAMWGNSVPTDWERCEGQSTAGNQALALVWGNNVPDLRYMFVRGTGPGIGVGSRGGRDNVTLTQANLPSHAHNLPDHTHEVGNTYYTTSTTHTHSGHDGGIAEAPDPLGGPSSPRQPVSLPSGGGVTGSFAGTGEHFEIIPSYYALTYIVKVA